MDNRIFNVNGRGREMLRSALELAFMQEGWDDMPARAEGWRVDPGKGLIFFWHAGEGAKKFRRARTAKQVVGLVAKWLESDQARNIPCNGWDADIDHDGSNERGWRVYVEDWGHIGEETYAICAVRPSFNWLGK